MCIDIQNVLFQKLHCLNLNYKLFFKCLKNKHLYYIVFWYDVLA